MKNLLNKLNYKTDSNERGILLDVYIIKNLDGTPRWIFPIHAKKPLFLKFYHVEGVRSRIFAFLSKVIFFAGLQTIAYSKETWSLHPQLPEQEPLIDLVNTQWALFTGTKGPNNKMILYGEKESGSFFLKIPTTCQTSGIVEKEKTGSEKAVSISPESFTVPSVKTHNNGILEIEDIGNQGKRSNVFSDQHKRVLAEICKKTVQVETTEKSACFNEGSHYLALAQLKNNPRIPKNLINKLKELETELTRSHFLTALAHGDFTPWNMFTQPHKLAIYDWELSNSAYPLGFDAFHFVIQKGIMIDRKSWKDIRKELESSVIPWFKTLLSKTDTKWEIYLKLYLFINISKHLDIYIRQENWHNQVHWLITTWNEALSDMTAKPENARSILIDDVFSLLSNKNYATIKFPVIPPNSLSPYSDIDICLSKNDSIQLVNGLKKHPLVQKVLQTKSSFMSQVQIILSNNEILNLDLIWQLKWKQMEMMNIEAVLERAQLNTYGVKAMHPNDLKTYLGLFYGLNNAMVPQKYEHHLSRDTEQHSVVHSLIDLSNKDQIVLQKELELAIKEMGANRGLSGIMNRVSYLLDTVYSMFNQRGMIITFSGVDGAGKSTIIERMRYEYEKKLRRRVVVLRHRPSILPILSAWTKGKAKAEQDSANSLPRQGTNNSILSSLLRFSYYYTDYLLGQFAVYTRYVLRGDIVLYDRYYFDFINDSVRSNIRLPERLLCAGYNFLIKPDFNFFLYADADTILARKQELDKDTIKRLTQKYLDLFKTLAHSKKASHRYVAIENRELEDTVGQIIRTTTGKAA